MTDTASAAGALELAYVGDAVYELLTRTYLLEKGAGTVQKLHRLNVDKVRASAQARAAQLLEPCLEPEEKDVYRRGRNAHVNSVPKGACTADYHSATGLEALFGWLWLSGRKERIRELFALITEEDNAT